MTISIVINEGKSDKKSFYILREIPNFVRNDNRSCYSEEALATEESFFVIGVILNRFLISFGMTILLPFGRKALRDKNFFNIQKLFENFNYIFCTKADV